MARTPDDPTKAQVWVDRVGNKFNFEFYFPQGPKGDAGGFVSPTLLLEGTDLNQIVSPGDYRIQSTFATLLLNFPRATMGGMLRVVATGGGSPIVHQMVLPLPAQNVRGLYQRSLVSGTWSAWQFLGSQVVDQTAGRTITTWDDVNNRSQLIYGDTGLRTITTNLLSGTCNLATLRRINNMVTFRLVTWAKDPAGIGNETIYTLPDGFRPDQTIFSGVGSQRGTANICQFDVGSAGSIVQQAPLLTSGVQLNLSWFTNQPWPTTLPGTASGSIPNL